MKKRKIVGALTALAIGFGALFGGHAHAQEAPKQRTVVSDTQSGKKESVEMMLVQINNILFHCEDPGSHLSDADLNEFNRLCSEAKKMKRDLKKAKTDEIKMKVLGDEVMQLQLDHAESESKILKALEGLDKIDRDADIISLVKVLEDNFDRLRPTNIDLLLPDILETVVKEVRISVLNLKRLGASQRLINKYLTLYNSLNMRLLKRGINVKKL